jgi:hypothetical protein
MISTFPEFRKREKCLALPCGNSSIRLHRHGDSCVLAQLRNYASDSVGVKACTGEPLLRELAGLWKIQGETVSYRLRDRPKKAAIRIFAIGRRREVYEERDEQFRQ